MAERRAPAWGGRGCQDRAEPVFGALFFVGGSLILEVCRGTLNQGQGSLDDDGGGNG